MTEPTTAAPTLAPTTQTSTMQAPTTTVLTAVSTTTFSGTVSITASSNLTQEMVESATKASLVAHLEIDPSLVTVMATQKRRLKVVTPTRRFADEWSIAYTITAPTSKMTALQSKATVIENDSTSFSASMKSELMKAGASSAEASITVSSFTGKVDTTSA